MYRNTVWTINILMMLLLSGCAPSTQALVEQAQISGDWTLVDKRYDAIERREIEKKQFCPDGTRLWCSKDLRKETCSCVKDTDFRGRLDSLLGL